MIDTIDIERAAIIQHDGGLPRVEAERLAAIEPQVPPNMLAAALSYAGRGWRVVPLHTIAEGRCTCGNPKCEKNSAKHPRIKDWTTVATTDEATIRSWWGRWPTANIGIATGVESGIIVLDVDPRDGGDRSLLELIDREGPIDYLAHVITGSGGDHYYLKHPGDRPVPNRVSWMPGIDIRADGGQVVAPPSLHASGARYVMCNAPSWGAAPKGPSHAD